MQIFDSFESGFYRWNNEGEVTAPNGWTPAWVDASGWVRPEYKPDPTPEHVFDGSVSAKMTHRFTKFDGLLYRTYGGIQPGSRVDIAAHFKAYSNPKGGLAGRIGIDTTGGTDFTDGVLWGDWWGQYQSDWSNEAWHQLTAWATAQSTSITVFLQARQDYPVNVTAAFWDAFTLYSEGTEPEPPTPPPSGGEFDYERLARAHEAFAAVCRDG